MVRVSSNLAFAGALALSGIVYLISRCDLMTKLNGWQRIGVIASVAWILVAGMYTETSESNRSSESIGQQHVLCESGLQGLTGDDWQKGFDQCNKLADEAVAEAYTDDWIVAALVAFVPVPLGWGFAYLVRFLVRWVKRGFMRPV